MQLHAVHRGHRLARCSQRDTPAWLFDAVENAQGNQRIQLVEAVKGENGDMHDLACAMESGHSRLGSRRGIDTDTHANSHTDARRQLAGLSISISRISKSLRRYSMRRSWNWRICGKALWMARCPRGCQTS